MRPISTLLLLISGLLSVDGAAPQFDREKVRRLAVIPNIDHQLGFSISIKSGFNFGAEPLEIWRLKPAAERASRIKEEIIARGETADRLFDLAEAYGDLGQTNQAKATLDRAVEAARQAAEHSPRDAFLKSKLGEALLRVDRKIEAERHLRAAAESTPGEWRAWKELGDYLISEALELLKSSLAPRKPGGAAGLSPEQRQEMYRLREEARRCYDKAVELAPGDPGPYTARAAFSFLSGTMLEQALFPDREQRDPAAAMRTMLDAILPDCKKAGDLSKTDVYAIGATGFFQTMRGLIDAPEGEDDKIWERVSGETRRIVSESIARLEKLTDDADLSVRSGALAALGTLEFIAKRNVDAAIGHLKRSLELRPESKQAWETLFVVLAEKGAWGELAEACQKRLRQGETAKVRLTLAKAWEKQKKLPEAAKEARKAAELDPSDLLYLISLFALQLAQAESEQALHEIGAAMANLEQNHAGRFQTSNPRLALEFEYLHAIYFALAGDRTEAKSHVRRLLAADSQNERFKELYEALGRP